MATERSYQDRGLPFRKCIGVALILIWSCVERTSNEVGYMVMSNWSIDLEQTWKPPRGRTCGHGSKTHHASQRAVVSSIHHTNWLFCCEAHRYWTQVIVPEQPDLGKFKCCHGCELRLNLLIFCEAKCCCCLWTSNNGRQVACSWKEGMKKITQETSGCNLVNMLWSLYLSRKLRVTLIIHSRGIIWCSLGQWCNQYKNQIRTGHVIQFYELLILRGSYRKS